MNTDLRSVEVNDVKLTYQESGTGAPVIFVHGSFSDARSWQYQIETFARGYRAIVYNRRHAFPNRTYGNEEDNSLEANAEDLLELIEELKLGSSHFVTVGTGSAIALVLARQRPDLVRSLIVADPGILSLLVPNPDRGRSLLWFVLRHPIQSRRLVRMNKALREVRKTWEGGRADDATRLLVDAFGPDDPRFPRKPGGPARLFDRMPRWIQSMFRDNVADISEGRGQDETSVFTLQDARKIVVPVLLIKAELFSTLYPVTNRLARAIPNSQIATIPGVGVDYGRWLEPYPFNELALGFLSQAK